jgi:hypothetical protein
MIKKDPCKKGSFFYTYTSIDTNLIFLLHKNSHSVGKI